MEQDGEVWVYIQHQARDVVEPSLEVLGKACELAAALKVSVAGVLAGDKVDVLAEKVLMYGAQKVYVLQSRHLEPYSSPLFFLRLQRRRAETLRHASHQLCAWG
jgi:electron transfer flavoprotein alpha subunit